MKIVLPFATTPYDATVDEVLDGDTVAVTVLISIDLGFGEIEDRRRPMRIRLAGSDTPERGQPGHDEATEKVRSVLPVGMLVKCQTFKPHEKYGRWLANITTPITITRPSELDVSAWMVANGYARPYGGGHKEPWTVWPLPKPG